MYVRERIVWRCRVARSDLDGSGPGMGLGLDSGGCRVGIDSLG